MKTISATEAKQRFAAVIDAAQREPVRIRRQKRDVAVVLSAEDYERVSSQATERAVAGTDLTEILSASPEKKPKRLGFLAGQISVPDDFDRMGQREIERLFRSKK